MKILHYSLVGASLLLSAGAASEIRASHAEQYCLVKAGSLLFSDEPVPTVTIIYSGTTTTTTLATFTNCEESRHTLPTSSPDSGNSLAPATDSRNAMGGQTSTERGESLTGSPASTVLNASALSSQRTPLTPNTVPASPSASILTQSTILNGGNTFTPSGATAVSGDGVNTQSGLARASDPQAVKSGSLSAAPTNSEFLPGESDAPKSPATDQRASDGAQASKALTTAAFSGAGSLSTTRSIQAVTTPGVPSHTGPLVPGESVGSWNSTLTLSPTAIDALQLAQFLKNLGASLFNSSRQAAAAMAGGNDNATASSELIASISLVSSDLSNPP
jgi:hypothetical protein